MGSSSYLGGKSVEKSSLRRSVENYDGKGSSSKRTTMSQLLQLLEEFEACRDEVEIKRAELGEAQKRLNDKEKEISRKLREFDPEIRDKFYAIMGALKDKGEER